MDLMERLNKYEVRELFSKNWLTHDAMWYGLCMGELGPEKANKLNKQAVRLMAGIEIGRIMKLMEKPRGLVVTRFEELEEIIDAAFRVVQADFLKFDFSFPEKNLLHGKFNKCFAHDGVKKFGMLENYDCGIVERIKGWIDAIGVQYEMIPDFKGCLMHQKGICEIDFKFNLEA